MLTRSEAIDDSLIDNALRLDQDLLKPGREYDAINQLANDTDLCKRPLTEPLIWTLNNHQRQYFANDLEAPTITRYPNFEAHELSRYAVLQLVLGLSVGRPFGLSDQRNGVIVQDIFPREDLLRRPDSSFGAYQSFAFHTDQAYNPDASKVPDHVLLACVRNNEQAATRVVHLAAVLDRLSDSTREQLAEADYQFFKGRPDEALGVRHGPILFEEIDGLKIRLGTDTVAGSAEAQKALDELRDTFEAVAKDVILRPGDILTVPNKSVPHARVGFTPDKQPTNRRWLQRVFTKLGAA